jgi:hypothetical protein
VASNESCPSQEPYLERANEGMDSSDLILLPFEKTEEQRRSYPQYGARASNGMLEDALEDGVGLHHIKLAAVQVLSRDL